MTRTSILSKLGIVGVLASMTVLPAHAQQKTIVDFTQANHTISTHGNFESRVTPNKVTVVFVVKTFDKLVTTAYSANTQNAQKLSALAAAMSISKNDVQTSEISIQPEYHYDQAYQIERYRPIGYTCSRNVAFVLKDVNKLATLLKSGLQDGANGIQAVSFENTDAPKYRATARIAALKAAREKAEALAEAVGCKVGKPVNITEGYASTYNLAGVAPALQGATNGTIGPQGVDAFVTNASQGVELGQLVINSDISATFELQ
jgi:uncharacterized protein YggE